MKTTFKNALTRRVNVLWLAVVCLLLASVLAVARSMVNDIAKAHDGITLTE